MKTIDNLYGFAYAMAIANVRMVINKKLRGLYIDFDTGTLENIIKDLGITFDDNGEIIKSNKI